LILLLRGEALHWIFGDGTDNVIAKYTHFGLRRNEPSIGLFGSIVPAPEPGSLTLLGIGGMCFLVLRMKR
jgi:hypothetical protein